MKLDLDQYAHLDSLLHRWDARYKLIGLIALIFSFAAVEYLWLVPAMIGITAILYVLSQLPLRYWLLRLRYPGFFLLSIVFMLPFLSGETVIWRWGMLTLRQEGCLAVVLIASRFISILTVGLILLGTTPFLSLVKAMRSLGLPVVLTDMMLLTYRYLFDIIDNLETMQRAMRLRGFRASTSAQKLSGWFLPDIQLLNRLASLAGTLFVRSYEQSERIYKAMKLRGYGSSAMRYQSARRRSPHSTLWDAIALVFMLGVAVGFAGIAIINPAG